MTTSSREVEDIFSRSWIILSNIQHYCVWWPINKPTISNLCLSLSLIQTHLHLLSILYNSGNKESLTYMAMPPQLLLRSFLKRQKCSRLRQLSFTCICLSNLVSFREIII